MRVLLLLAVLALAGCGSIDCVMVRAMRSSDNVILKEYVAYIQADDSLTDTEKADILAHVEKRRALLEEAASQCE